jgi:hypothetical protein
MEWQRAEPWHKRSRNECSGSCFNQLASGVRGQPLLAVSRLDLAHRGLEHGPIETQRITRLGNWPGLICGDLFAAT